MSRDRYFWWLAVFDASLDVGVRGLDETGKGCGVCDGSGPQLYMAHELAIALQQMGWVRQRRALEEALIDVRGEDVDVAEGRVSEAGCGAAVMQKFADFVAAASHHLKPLLRDGS